MNKTEPSSNIKSKLEKKHLSTRRRMKVLSALYANFQSPKGNGTLEDSCDVTKHGQTVLNLLQNERLGIENLKELQKLLLHPALKEAVVCVDEMADIVAEMLRTHEVIHQDLYKEDCTVATSLSALLPLLKTYKRYSAIVDLNFTALQDYAYIYEEGKVSFRDLLYEPIFQINRYKFLLQDFSDSMPSENTYEHILLELNKLSESIGSEISLKQNMLKSLQVQRLLVKRQPKILNFQRTLLKEGILCEVKCHGSKLKTRVVFLFSDVLLCCRLISKSFDWNTKNSLKCCSLLPLSACSVDFVMGKVLFKVTSGNISCLFLSETLEDAQSWVKHVQSAIKMCQLTQNKPKNIKRKPVVKHGKSPFIKASQDSTILNVSDPKSPNVSNITSSENTSFQKFKRMLTCAFGMKAF